jgi:hypothetical protein
LIQILPNGKKTNDWNKIPSCNPKYLLKLGNNRAWSSTWVNFKAFAFIIYINDLPPTINTLAIPIIFTDDTSVIISSKNLDDICMLSNRVLCLMSKWFTANKLTLNLYKTNIIKFTAINLSQCPLSNGYNDKYIEETVHKKFLGLHIDNHLNWKNHINWLIPKLSGACYAVRSLLHISNTDTLKSIYYAYCHSLMKYWIIFWGKTSKFL